MQDKYDRSSNITIVDGVENFRFLTFEITFVPDGKERMKTGSLCSFHFISQLFFVKISLAFVFLGKRDNKITAYQEERRKILDRLYFSNGTEEISKS